VKKALLQRLFSLFSLISRRIAAVRRPDASEGAFKIFAEGIPSAAGVSLARKNDES
jgi:hypothetical protein